jgi:Flp pilus assembly pilin Flp
MTFPISPGVWVAASIGRMTQRRKQRGPSQRGQSLAEYALIVSLIVIVALVALTFFGTQINDILSIIADTIDG